MEHNINLRVLEFTAKIPLGKVTTYGKLAKLSGIRSARLIGKILHKNPDPAKFPCHRVVNSMGKLSQNYAFGGINAQKQKLEAEGIEVKNGKVDLDKYLWQGI